MKVVSVLLAGVVWAGLNAHGVCAATNVTPVSGSGATQPGESKPAEASPWSWLAMPKITMPKITMPKMPADPLAPVKTSAKKVSEGASKAWEGTKEIFTFGPAKSNATTPAAPKADQSKSPSLWQKMFGGGEKKQEPEGPRTVAEWMAQPRLDP